MKMMLSQHSALYVIGSVGDALKTRSSLMSTKNAMNVAADVLDVVGFERLRRWTSLWRLVEQRHRFGKEQVEERDCAGVEFVVESPVERIRVIIYSPSPSGRLSSPNR